MPNNNWPQWGERLKQQTNKADTHTHEKPETSWRFASAYGREREREAQRDEEREREKPEKKKQEETHEPAAATAAVDYISKAWGSEKVSESDIGSI